MTAKKEGRFIQTAFTLAWPISLQSILTNLLSMIDIAMVSHLGDEAVAAVGLGNRFQFVLMVVLLGNSWAVGVLAAQYYGAKQAEKIRSTVAIACLLAFIALCPLFISIIFLADDIIRLGTDNTKIIALGQQYLWYVIPSLVFVAVILAYENALRSLGQVKTPLALNAISAAINVVLNYWFINGGLGIPALGVVGAAIATTLARFIHMILLLYLLYNNKHILLFNRQAFNRFANRERVIQFIAIGAPMMFSFGVWSSGTFVYQIIYGKMGTRELAAMSLLTPIEGIYLALFFGLASACSITVGQHLGANRFQEAWRCAINYALFNPVVCFIAGLFILLVRDIILMAFSGLPSSTLHLAENVLILLSITTFLKVINMTLAMGVLRAGGDNKICLYVDTIGMWMVSLPCTALAAFYFQLPLLWVVLVTYSEEICKGILFIRRVRQKVWLRNLT